MGFYPYNPTLGQEIQTDIPGHHVDRSFGAHLTWDAPAAASNNAVLAATALADGAVTTVVAGITNPDVPRALRVRGNAATAVGNVVATGTNMAGAVITETIIAAGDANVEGNLAFATVTQIVLPARGAAGDTISIGYNDKLGLPYLLPVNTVLAAAINNVREATAPTVTVSATVLAANTCDLDSALNATQVDAWLLV